MLALAIILVTIILDQLTKYWAETYLKSISDIPLIKNIFHLTYVENRGAAFGILQNHRWLFISVTIIIIIVLLYFLYIKKVKYKPVIVAFALIIGGGIGNLISRLGFNFSEGFNIKDAYVVDFLEFRFINFAVFNLADTFVTIGAILFAVIYFFNSNALEGGEKNEIHSDNSEEGTE